MKKMKFIKSLLGFSALSGVVVPLAGCSCSTSNTKTFTVHFDAGSGITNPNDQTVIKDGLANWPKDPTNPGKKVEGWYKQSSYTNLWNFTNDKVTADITLYAKWVDDVQPTTSKWKVEFDTDGGSFVETQLIKNGEHATSPTSTKEGYGLEGWYTDSGLSQKFDFANTPITKDIKLYAKWVPGFTQKGLTYLSIDETTCEVKWDKTDQLPNVVKIPETVTDPATNVTKTVVKVADNGFYPDSKTCYYIRELILPDTVHTIGSGAFSNCKLLANVTLGSGIKAIGDSAFQSCENLVNINLREGITTIGNSAFQSCPEITTVVLPSTLKTLGNYAFTNCSKLTNVTLNEGLETLGRLALSSTGIQTIEIPTTITKWGVEEDEGYNFAYCDSLTSVKFKNNNLTTLPQYMFNSCGSLSNVELPTSLTSIPDGMFQYNGSLSTITLPESLLEIGENAFSNSGLTEVTLPNGVTTLKNYAFSSCDSLTKVTIGKKLDKITRQVFTYSDNLSSVTFTNPNNWYLNNGEQKVVTDPAAAAEVIKNLNWQNDTLLRDTELQYLDIVDENGLAYVKWKGETSPTTLEVPAKIIFHGSEKSISGLYYDSAKNKGAFEGCTSSSIVLPDSIIYITKNAFKGTKFNEITLPSDAVVIGENAFEGAAVTKVTFTETIDKWNINNSGTIVPFDPAGKTAAEVAEALKTTYVACKWSRASTLNKLTLTEIGEGTKTVSVKAKDKNITGVVIIPESVTIDGTDYTVTEIEADGFGSYDDDETAQITNVFIPKTITKIGSEAFENCPLIELNIPTDSTLQVVGTDAFNYTKISSIFLPGTITSFSSRLEIETLKKLEFGSGFSLEKFFGSDGTILYGCPNIEWINVPAGITEIYDYWLGYYDKEELKIKYVKFDDCSKSWYIGESTSKEDEFTPSETDLEGNAQKILQHLGYGGDTWHKSE